MSAPHEDLPYGVHRKERK